LTFIAISAIIYPLPGLFIRPEMGSPFRNICYKAGILMIPGGLNMIIERIERRGYSLLPEKTDCVWDFLVFR